MSPHRIDAEGLLRLLGRLNEGIVSVDRSLDVRFANAAALRLLGVESLDPGDPLPDPWPNSSLRDFALALFESDVREKELTVSPAEDSTFVVGGIGSGGADTAVLVITDVSERERRERAEREFIANAAHELRTPLTAITSAIEVLQAGAKELQPERDLFLGHIERECNRLRRLAQALLTLARVEALREQPRLEIVELRPLLREAADSIHPGRGVEVEVECPSDLAALANREMVEQALSVVGTNSAKYTREGRILLSGRRVDDDRVVIEVIDTGPGIPDDVLQRLGRRFQRGEASDGFGLGLAIASRVARSLGGSLALESTSGRGTTARLELRAADLTSP